MAPCQFEKSTQRLGAYCCILVQDLQSPRRVTLKMEAARPTEMSVNIYQRTHRHIQDYWILQKNCCCQNIGYYAENLFMLHSVKNVICLHSKYHVC